jgi:putative phosphoesterase
MFIVMSDSHMNRQVVENIKDKYLNQASAIFHCGDSELPSDDRIWQGITVVKGNCDYDEGYPDFTLEEVEGKRILITHGHLFDVGFGLESYAQFAQEKKADVALFGHIHQPVAQIINQTLFLNPGSVEQPRGQINIKMYAVIKVTSTGYDISYHNLNHDPVENLQFKLEV